MRLLGILVEISMMEVHLDVKWRGTGSFTVAGGKKEQAQGKRGGSERREQAAGGKGGGSERREQAQAGKVAGRKEGSRRRRERWRVGKKGAGAGGKGGWVGKKWSRRRRERWRVGKKGRQAQAGKRGGSERGAAAWVCPSKAGTIFAGDGTRRFRLWRYYADFGLIFSCGLEDHFQVFVELPGGGCGCLHGFLSEGVAKVDTQLLHQRAL